MTNRIFRLIVVSYLLMFSLSAPGESASGESVLVESVPIESVSVESVPSESVPDESAVLTYFELLNRVQEIPFLLESGEIQLDQVPNPHWKADACVACHDTPKRPRRDNLYYDQVEKTCGNCHLATLNRHRTHPASVKPSEAMLSRMNRRFKKSLSRPGGEVTCSTCHNLVLQCKLKRKKLQLTNPSFFRVGPFKTRTQQCYYCHDADLYQRASAHDQVDKKGSLKEKSSLTCHTGSIEQLKEAKSIEEVEFLSKGDLSSLCWGCHPQEPHPGGQFTFFKSESGPDHFIKPPKAVLKRMQKMAKKNELILPLDPETGRIFCGTCHNPHAEGVIKAPEAAKGADSEKRLRAQKMCTNCHNK